MFLRVVEVVSVGEDPGCDWGSGDYRGWPRTTQRKMGKSCPARADVPVVLVRSPIDGLVQSHVRVSLRGQSLVPRGHGSWYAKSAVGTGADYEDPELVAKGRHPKDYEALLGSCARDRFRPREKENVRRGDGLPVHSGGAETSTTSSAEGSAGKMHVTVTPGVCHRPRQICNNTDNASARLLYHVVWLLAHWARTPNPQQLRRQALVLYRH